MLNALHLNENRSGRLLNFLGNRNLFRNLRLLHNLGYRRLFGDNLRLGLCGRLRLGNRLLCLGLGVLLKFHFNIFGAGAPVDGFGVGLVNGFRLVVVLITRHDVLLLVVGEGDVHAAFVAFAGSDGLGLALVENGSLVGTCKVLKVFLALLLKLICRERSLRREIDGRLFGCCSRSGLLVFLKLIV